MRQIPPDKSMHIIAGVCWALVLLPVHATAAALGCLLIALAREGYGWWSRGRWCWADIACTMLGGSLVLIAAAIGPGGLWL